MRQKVTHHLIIDATFTGLTRSIFYVSSKKIDKKKINFRYIKKMRRDLLD